MYSYDTHMLLVYTCMSSVCHLYVLVCHPYVTGMYSYVIRLSLVCTCMSLVCHSYFTRMYSCVTVCNPYVLVCYLYVTFFFFFFFFYQGFLSRTLTAHRTAGEGRRPSFIPLFHFHPLTNIQTFICNFAREMTITYF